MNDELLTPREVSNMLGIGEASLTQMRYNKSGPKYVKVNSRVVRYEAEAVREWIDSNTITPSTDESGR